MVVVCMVVACMVVAYVEATAAMYYALFRLCLSRRFDPAELWVATLLDAGTLADVACFSAVVHACAKANGLLRAVSWVFMMLEAMVSPNVVTFNSVINASARCEDADRTEGWLEQLVLLALLLVSSPSNH